MDADSELDDLLAPRGAAGVELRDAAAHLERRARGRGRAVGRIAHRTKDRHEPVAREFVEDAALVEDAPTHDREVFVHRRHECFGWETLGERRRPAQVGKEDRHGLTLALEPQRIALDHALDNGRRKEPLEPAPAVELEEEGTERQYHRDEHEPVVFPPRRRPRWTKELRDLRLRE